MIKQLLFSLALTSTAIHSMELVLHNPNILPHVTEKLCAAHDMKPSNFKKEIGTLSQTNKALCIYYENNIKNIVRMVARGHCICDQWAAEYLGQKTILNKIEYLFSIASDKNKSFSPEDLQDNWYLTATKSSWQRSLLRTAIEAAQITNVTMLTELISDINADSNTCSLWSTAKSLLKSKGSEFNNLNLLIAQLLLHKKANPDDRPTITSHTPLMICIWENHKEFARLLLEHEANPYLLLFNEHYYKHRDFYTIKQAAKQYPIDTILPTFNEKKPWLQNAFNCGNEESQKWFRAMVDDVAKSKKIT